MKLSIIIVNWNTGPLLRKCLDALPYAALKVVDGAATCVPFKYEVFVVDNASRDNSLTHARESYQPFTHISLPKNVGFARANNIALRQARGDILLLLNPDTEPRPGSFSALMNFFATHPKAGIVGGKLLNTDGSLQRSVRRFPTPIVLALLLTRLARLQTSFPAIRRYEMADFPYGRDTKVDQVMGACFAIRRGVVDVIGLLDEGYWIWFEEVDYCRRAKLAGWETWFTPSAEVVHDRATSFAQVSPLWRAWQFSRSALRYTWKHQGWWAAIGLSTLVPVSLGTALIASLSRKPPSVRRV
ncbi:MAG: glycosyl transferase family protein [Parcubacteria group bacterium Gr01-1014_38]|nr:MAG: glycosyl transferase family protein [Parcubacteria group bacterium Gr01-1014_38]